MPLEKSNHGFSQAELAVASGLSGGEGTEKNRINNRSIEKKRNNSLLYEAAKELGCLNGRCVALANNVRKNKSHQNVSAKIPRSYQNNRESNNFLARASRLLGVLHPVRNREFSTGKNRNIHVPNNFNTGAIRYLNSLSVSPKIKGVLASLIQYVGRKDVPVISWIKKIGNKTSADAKHIYEKGVFCGATVAQAFQSQGLSIPKQPLIAKDWKNIGMPISRNNLEPGDIIITSRPGNESWQGHVGVYLGDGKMIGGIFPKNSDGKVLPIPITTMPINNPQFRFLTARRVS